MATLVKQSAFPELDAMERQFRRLLSMPLMPAFVAPAIPAADVYETPREFVVELEVPGYEEKELTLELSDHTLAVKGVRGETTPENDKSYRLRERLEQRFERTFALPQEVDGEHITAAFEKGVLKVHAPKLTTAKPRTITITKP